MVGHRVLCVSLHVKHTLGLCGDAATLAAEPMQAPLASAGWLRSHSSLRFEKTKLLIISWVEATFSSDTVTHCSGMSRHSTL